MNNSVFGKTMENVRNRQDIRLVTTVAEAEKLNSKPNFKSASIFDENLVAVHMGRTECKIDKPIYVGAAILDLSKTLMYDFHYNYVKPKWGGKAQLLFTDTNSLVYEIETEDFYKDIEEDIPRWFDTSAYPNNHTGVKLRTNKKVLGMMKDETAGDEILEFVGLRAKLYAYRTLKEEKKCKGIRKYVIKQSITFDDYKQCLFSSQKQNRSMNLIRSHHHEIYSESVNKVALSCEDDKRIILDNNVDTLAISHWRANHSL